MRDKKLLSLIIILMTVSMMIYSCGSSDSNQVDTTEVALHEYAFKDDPNLYAKFSHVTVLDFEHAQESNINEKDSGTTGVDIIPYIVRQEGNHTFELEDIESANYYAILRNENEEEVARIDANGIPVTVWLVPGDYKLYLYNMGTKTFTLFLQPLTPIDSSSNRQALYNIFHVAWYWMSGKCSHCDLSHANLSNVTLVPLIGAVDLSYANLTYANLQNAGFPNANLKSANLSNANLFLASFDGANLDDASLKHANLDLTNLSNTSMHRTDLSDTDIGGVFFFDAGMSNANLSSARIDTCDFEGAYLENASFYAAKLVNTGLTYTRMNGAYMKSANFHRVDFSHADLGSADLSNTHHGFTNFSHADLSGANLFNAVLSDSLYRDSYADFTNAILAGATWVDGRECGPNSLGQCDL
jgi:uncharacterized protein YjbI with pentapeptide repeats